MMIPGFVTKTLALTLLPELANSPHNHHFSFQDKKGPGRAGAIEYGFAVSDKFTQVCFASCDATNEETI